MTTANYLNGRKEYQRPQAILWSDTSPNVTIQTQTGLLIPDGVEYGANVAGATNFIILTDDNRTALDFSPNRIEQRQRMINGRMRSFHIADKMNLSLSWNMVPSRSFINDPKFSTTTGESLSEFNSNYMKYTTDGGAGGNELLDWYESHTGPFYVYLAYDKYPDIQKNVVIKSVLGNGTTTTYTTESGKYNKLVPGDIVVISGCTTGFNGVYTVKTASAESFTVSNSAEIIQTAQGTTALAISRNTLAQYNEVIEMYISDFSYSVQKRGGSNYDFWNISVSLEEV